MNINSYRSAQCTAFGDAAKIDVSTPLKTINSSEDARDASLKHISRRTYGMVMQNHLLVYVKSSARYTMASKSSLRKW